MRLLLCLTLCCLSLQAGSQNHQISYLSSQFPYSIEQNEPPEKFFFANRPIIRPLLRDPNQDGQITSNIFYPNVQVEQSLKPVDNNKNIENTNSAQPSTENTNNAFSSANPNKLPIKFTGTSNVQWPNIGRPINGNRNVVDSNTVRPNAGNANVGRPYADVSAGSTNFAAGQTVPSVGSNISSNNKDVHIVYPQKPNTELQPPSADPYPNQGSYGFSNTDTETRFGEDDSKIILNESGESVTNFGMYLLKDLNEVKKGNIVLSPYSITTLLALLQQAASGNTLIELTGALQMVAAKSLRAYKGINEDFRKRSSYSSILRTANNLYISRAFSINPEFKRIANTDFGSDLTPTSFENPVQTAQDINKWVSDKTNNKIEKILNPDALSTNTQLVLVNAIYFKGKWEIPFKTQGTRPLPFELEDGTTKTVPFMKARRNFRSGIDQETGTKVVILPFEDNEYSLMLLLPSRLIKFSEVLSTLTIVKLSEYLTYPVKDIGLEIPKFSIKADTDLREALTKMGVTNMFTEHSELFGLSSQNSQSPQISSAVHSAVFSIDEEGGTGAAATAFNVVALSNDSPSLHFKANRPFIGILWDNRSSVPLFMMKVADPSI